MASPLITTKLYIPSTRQELVPRPRLVEWIDEGLRRKLSLISAPAGFGKTTLVTVWLESLRTDTINKTKAVNRIAWFSLDGGDKKWPKE